MQRGLLAAPIVLAALSGCADPYPARTIDCPALVDAYTTGCGGHLGISIETTACDAIDRGQNGPLAPSIDRAAAVCERASMDPATPSACDEIFVCLDDEHGLSGLARAVMVTGKAKIEGEVFPLAATDAWAWIGTTTGGNPGDFEVLFSVNEQPWYFRLDDLAQRARTRPFAVDAARPIKLENAEDNLELVTGTVTITAFAQDGAFDIAASGTDPATGESLDLRFVGSFAAD